MTITEKLTAIAENEQKVYDAGFAKGEEEGHSLGYSDGYDTGYGIGFSKGKATGYDEGVEVGFENGREMGYNSGYNDGQQAQYDLFWDSVQNRGIGGVTYTSRFRDWNFPNAEKIYNPKYDFYHPSKYSATNTFREWTKISDILKDNYFDRAQCHLEYTFYYSTSLVDARTLHVKEDTTFTGPFLGCSKLQEIRFAGTIGQNGLSFVNSGKLSRTSIESIIGALSSAKSGLTITFSKTSVDNAFETSVGTADGSTSTEWTTLRNTKANWTISLA